MVGGTAAPFFAVVLTGVAVADLTWIRSRCVALEHGFVTMKHLPRSLALLITLGADITRHKLGYLQRLVPRARNLLSMFSPASRRPRVTRKYLLLCFRLCFLHYFALSRLSDLSRV